MSIDVFDGIKNHTLLEAVQVLQAHTAAQRSEHYRRQFLDNLSTFRYCVKSGYLDATSAHLKEYAQTGADLASVWLENAAAGDRRRICDAGVAFQMIAQVMYKGDLRDELLGVLDAIATMFTVVGTIVDESSSSSFSRERSPARRIDMILNHLPFLHGSFSFLRRIG